MKKNKLSFDQTSDLEKQIEGDIVEEKLEKEADLYYSTLFMPIPITHDFSLGVFPDDQQLSTRHVLLWNSVKSIPTSISDNNYKIIKVVIPHKAIVNQMKSVSGGVYALSLIPNMWKMQEVNSVSFREE